MKALPLVILLTAVLSGCVATTGNYVYSATNSTQTQVVSVEPLVQSALSALQQKYPPAKSALKVKAPTEDFGQKLVGALRSAGYAVYEEQVAPVQQQETPIPAEAKELRYVFDVLDVQNGLYQMTVMVENTRLACVFKASESGYSQVSPWTAF